MGAKVIFHIDELQKWRLLLHNVKNLLSSYEDATAEVAIEVLANGDAVQAYVADAAEKMQTTMQSLQREGVLFAACNNALTGQNISREALIPFVQIVPTGVRELVDRQMQGYAYIKP